MSKSKKEPVVTTVKEDEKSLTQDEQQKLAEFEKVIEQSQKNFITVGEALTQIAETKLYKGTHCSFDQYCEERWDFSGSHARRLMDAYAVVKKLRSGPKPIIEEDLPRNEYQARLLGDLKAKHHWIGCWRTVLKKAKKEKKRITVAFIEAALSKDGEVAAPKAKAAKNVTAPPAGVAQALERIGQARQQLAKNESVDIEKLLTELETLLKAN